MAIQQKNLEPASVGETGSKKWVISFALHFRPSIPQAGDAIEHDFSGAGVRVGDEIA